MSRVSLTACPTPGVVVVRLRRWEMYESRETRAAARARPSPLCSRRAAEDSRPHQAQHERESISAFAQSVARSKSGGGRTTAVVSESHGVGVARKTGEAACVQAREHHHWQRLG